MKIYIHYEETLEEDLKMTVKLTLPRTTRRGPISKLQEAFIEGYNKKHSNSGTIVFRWLIIIKQEA